jgi:hypothetical protein
MLSLPSWRLMVFDIPFNGLDAFHFVDLRPWSDTVEIKMGLLLVISFNNINVTR